LQILLGTYPVSPAFPASQHSLLLLFLNPDQDPHGASPSQHGRHNTLRISGSAKANSKHPAAEEELRRNSCFSDFPQGKE